MKRAGMELAGQGSGNRLSFLNQAIARHRPLPETRQPIFASAPGKVVYSGSGLRGYGKLIIIKHTRPI